MKIWIFISAVNIHTSILNGILKTVTSCSIVVAWLCEWCSKFWSNSFLYSICLMTFPHCFPISTETVQRSLCFLILLIRSSVFEALRFKKYINQSPDGRSDNPESRRLLRIPPTQVVQRTASSPGSEIQVQIASQLHWKFFSPTSYTASSNPTCCF